MINGVHNFMKCYNHSCFLVGSARACVNGILTGTLKALFSQPISRMSSTIRTCRKVAKCIWTSYDFHGHLSIWSAKARHPVSYCKRTSRNDASDDYLPPICKAPLLEHRTLRVNGHKWDMSAQVVPSMLFQACITSSSSQLATGGKLGSSPRACPSWTIWCKYPWWKLLHDGSTFVKTIGYFWVPIFTDHTLRRLPPSSLRGFFWHLT